MLRLFYRLSLQKKLLIFMMSLVLFFGSLTGLLIRFVVFPYLIREMEGRGVAVAHHVAERSRIHILTNDTAGLAAMFLDEKASDKNIVYILATDQAGRLLAHTFIHGVPESISNRGPEEARGTHPAVSPTAPALQRGVSEIVVPVREGDRRIGTVRLGLDKQFIDRVINELKLYHLGFVAFITLLGLVFGLYLSRVLTRPITSLTNLVGEISKGNLNTYITLGPQRGTWNIMTHPHESSRAHAHETSHPSQEPAALRYGSSAADRPLPEDSRSEQRVSDLQPGDEITQLAEAFNHMTSRLRISEIELRLSEQRYRLLFNRDPNPVFVIEPISFAVIDANERASEKYGHLRDELLGMKFMDLGFEEDSAQIISALSISGQEGRACSLLPRIRQRHKNGTIFWVNIYYCTYEYSGMDALIATTTDITQIIDTEAKLIQAGKMATVGEMSTGIAHELNQSLNAIKLGCQFLLTMVDLGKPIPEGDLRQVAHDLNQEVDRASGIINHLREFGRRSGVYKHKVDVNASVRGALTILGQQLRVHGIQVIVDLDDALPAVLADENRIEQVLINLINNARDAMDSRRDRGMESEEAVLTIKSYAENGRVVLSVGDTGTGMPPAVRERIFEPFFTTKAVGKGTGLGLSISYGIVRDYEGSIDFQTEEGVGTVFTLSFPMASEEAEDE